MVLPVPWILLAASLQVPPPYKLLEWDVKNTGLGMVLPGLWLMLPFAWHTASQTPRCWGLWQGKRWLKTANQGAASQNSQASRQEKESQTHFLEGKGCEIFIYKEVRLSEAWGKVMGGREKVSYKHLCRCLGYMLLHGLHVQKWRYFSKISGWRVWPSDIKKSLISNCAGPVLGSVVPTCFHQPG